MVIDKLRVIVIIIVSLLVIDNTPGCLTIQTILHNANAKIVGYVSNNIYRPDDLYLRDELLYHWDELVYNLGEKRHHPDE